MTVPLCTVEGCGRQPIARRLCTRHYQAEKKRGGFRPLPRMTLRERFDSLVSPEPTSGCWLWVGHCVPFGHGTLTFRDRQYFAHRLSWQLHQGSIPKGLCVCHHCDNPACVNPAHLYVGTRSDNNRDMIRRGRYRHVVRMETRPRGRDLPQAKLTDQAVAEIRRAYARGGATHRALAAKYGVSHQVIGRLLRGGGWKHVA